MIFFMAYLLLFFGVFLAGVIGLLPLQVQVVIPDYFRMILFAFGMIIAFLGLIMIHSRAIKTGVHHLIEPGKPNRIHWFYIYRDGSIKITPSVREVEGQLYCPELDAQIQDMKSYRIFDHPVRFVPEGTGHAIDLGKCLYAQFLKTKFGFANLREARDGGFNLLGYPKAKKVVGREYYEDEEYDQI